MRDVGGLHADIVLALLVDGVAAGAVLDGGGAPPASLVEELRGLSHHGLALLVEPLALQLGRVVAAAEEAAALLLPVADVVAHLVVLLQRDLQGGVDRKVGGGR
jgi:hypothetical protein